MIYPSIDKLLNQVGSKYLLVNIVAKRAREMSETEYYQMKDNEYVSKKNIGRALEEVSKDLIHVKIECTLYEKKQNINKELDKLYYDNDEIKLKDFLENIEFDLEDFSKMCRSYDNDSLYLEINATTKDNKTTNYKVSLSINECN